MLGPHRAPGLLGLGGHGPQEDDDARLTIRWE
jgi:hypothetical protein